MFKSLVLGSKLLLTPAHLLLLQRNRSAAIAAPGLGSVENVDHLTDEQVDQWGVLECGTVLFFRSRKLCPEKHRLPKMILKILRFPNISPTTQYTSRAGPPNYAGK